ncbi:MAG: iron ABC transporter permease [Deltaproteobacteria bacterium]|nr:iron ABC transporter permease [Deltaproteobacteria bacterium]
MALALRVGVTDVSFLRAWQDPESLDRVLLSARASRVALGAVAGGSLALVGAAFQALLRNPLGDPYALGVSGGGALGATLAVLLGAGGVLVPLAAFVGAVGATAVVLLTARGLGRGGVQGLLLAGLVVNAFANAALAFLRSAVSSAQAQGTLSILLGALSEEPAERVLQVTSLAGVGICVLGTLSKAMNLLVLGEDSASSLGVDVPRAERWIFLASSLVVAAVVSVCGLIPFVGLVVPHYARAWTGPDHRTLLPACFLGGATLLVLADLATRMVFLWLHNEPPVGALTAMLGAPFFLVVLRRLGDEAG